MKSITIFIFISLFLLFRPYQLQNTGMWYKDDDYDYFAHASSIVFGQFPSYEKEFFLPINNSKSPLGSIGSGVMAAPFVFIFSLIDRCIGSDIVQQRTEENVRYSWSLFGFIFASSVYLWLGCLALYKGLRYFFKDRHAALSVIITVLCQGIPLFVFRRPVFSHVYEFFLQSIMMFLLLSGVYFNNKKVLRRDNYWKDIGIGVLIGFIYLVRYNNLFFALMWPIILLIVNKYDIKSFKFWKKLSLSYFVMIAIIGCLKWLPNMYCSHTGYVNEMQKLTTLEPIMFYFKRLIHVFFAVDWGLIYTAPFVLVGLFSMFLIKSNIKKYLLICLLPSIVNLYIIMMWKTQGGWYGYRYIIAAIIPLLVYPNALFLELGEKKYGKRIWFLLGALILLPLLSMLCFEGSRGYLVMNVVEQYFGVSGWSNNMYQMQIWKMFLFEFFDLVYVIFNGGFYYLGYLLSLLLNCISIDIVLPSYFYEYRSFQISVLLKTSIIYCMPFCLFLIFKKAWPSPRNI